MTAEAQASAPADPLPCNGKSYYPTRKRAAQAASRLRNRIRVDTGADEPIRPYHCEHCKDWHIGHPVGWRRENNRPRTGWEPCETNRRFVAAVSV